MTPSLSRRIVLSAFGFFGGAAFYVLNEGVDQSVISGHLGLVLGCFFSVGFGGSLLLSAAMGLRRAMAQGFALAVLVAAMSGWASLRWQEAEGFFYTPWASFAAVTLALMPLPFLMAREQSGHLFKYEYIFQNIWFISARLLISVVLTLCFWLFLLLSDALLSSVGLDFISRIVSVEWVALPVSGMIFGLSIALSNELSISVTPGLGLWFLRFLLPLVTLVSLLFIIGAADYLIRGQLHDISSSFVLLVMGYSGLLLVVMAMERDEEHQSRSPIVVISAKVMSVTTLVMALLAFWMVAKGAKISGWSVDDYAYGFAAIMLAAYGLGAIWGLAQGEAWGGSLRLLHLCFAVLSFAAALLWLSPLFNAEKMAAKDHLSRYTSGTLSAADYRDWRFVEMGKAGAQAKASLRAMAVATGQQDFVSMIDGRLASSPGRRESERLIKDLRDILPVSPAGGTAMRDAFLAMMQPWDLEDILNACAIHEEDGTAGCVLVVADLLPHSPGEEGVLLLDRGGWISFEGLSLKDGHLIRSEIKSASGELPSHEEARAMIAAWQQELPPLTPLSVNQLGQGRQGLFFTP